MATFTDDEYSDTARIARGYDEFFQVLVPFSLDKEFGELNHLILFRDNAYGVKNRPCEYKVLDGVEEVRTGTLPEDYSASQHLEKVVAGTFQPHAFTPQELAEFVISRAQQSADGTAVIFVKSANTTGVNMALSYSDGTLSVTAPGYSTYNPNWETISSQCEFAPDGTVTSVGQNVERRVELMLDEIADSSHQIMVMTDSGIAQTDITHPSIDGIRERTLASPLAQKMCLMLTTDFVLPSLENDGNIPTPEELENLMGPGLSTLGNCIEVATSIGLNSMGGVGGKLVNPRLRILPTHQALTNDPAIMLLWNLDPLHHQSLESRVFGNQTELSGQGTEIEEVEIRETGSIISTYGHTFYARRDGGIDVYDPALHFAGELAEYQSLLYVAKCNPHVRDISHVTPFSQERTDFHRACRASFRDPEVEKLTCRTYDALPPDAKTMHSLYQCWNSALVQFPEKIAASMRVAEFAHPVASPKKIVGVATIEEMFSTIDSGFVCLERTIVGSAPSSVIVFKDGDNVFVADGRHSCTPRTDLTNVLNDSAAVSYDISSFGGNNFERMNEIYQSAVGRSPAVKTDDFNR